MAHVFLLNHSPQTDCVTAPVCKFEAYDNEELEALVMWENNLKISAKTFSEL